MDKLVNAENEVFRQALRPRFVTANFLRLKYVELRGLHGLGRRRHCTGTEKTPARFLPALNLDPFRVSSITRGKYGALVHTDTEPTVRYRIA